MSYPRVLDRDHNSREILWECASCGNPFTLGWGNQCNKCIREDERQAELIRAIEANRESSKERVLAVYPQAHVQTRVSGIIDIIDSRSRSSMAIGCGKTDVDAWQDAEERTGIASKLPAPIEDAPTQPFRYVYTGGVDPQTPEEAEAGMAGENVHNLTQPSAAPESAEPRIQEIRARLEAATKGQWEQAHRGPNNYPIVGAQGVLIAMISTGVGFEDQAEGNAALIAAAPDDIAYLLSQLREALATIERLGIDRDRWKEDSMRQAATINRMARAAEDRNEVDKLRAAEVERLSPKADGELNWEGMAGSIIDTVHLTPEDFVNEELVKHLKLYFRAPKASEWIAEVLILLNRVSPAMKPSGRANLSRAIALLEHHQLSAPPDANQPRKPSDFIAELDRRVAAITASGKCISDTAVRQLKEEK